MPIIVLKKTLFKHNKIFKENRRKRRGKRGRVLEDDDFEVAKEKFPEIAKEIEELDYQVDLAGGVPCKFKYRETEKQDFGQGSKL